MGVHDPTHRGQLLASQRQTESTPNQPTCCFCGGTLAEEGGGERVEHVLPAGGGREARTERYCSPSCFVRQMEQVGNFE
ncbi:hypothetical protein [Salinibaculum rarum]|uniref:hypothetical protein n=1 Tax=Salinibaculum rarum TaxID=3058903 RepID=UPI00265F23FF|nr:hypothetical protein [Salinibaculum sp. KK48]